MAQAQLSSHQNKRPKGIFIIEPNPWMDWLNVSIEPNVCQLMLEMNATEFVVFLSTIVPSLE